MEGQDLEAAIVVHFPSDQNLIFSGHVMCAITHSVRPYEMMECLLENSVVGPLEGLEG